MKTNPDPGTATSETASRGQGGGETAGKRARQLPPPPEVSAEERAEAMDPECVSFLNLQRKPAVGYDVEAGWLLGFSTEAIGTLVAEGHLPALAALSSGDQKRFSTSRLLKLAKDESWMNEATDIVYRSHRKEAE